MVITPELPLTGPEGEFQAEPVAILERKMKKKKREMHIQFSLR